MRSVPLFLSLGILFYLHAEPAQASKLSGLLHDWLFPEPGEDVADEIKCYNLPFGGIGFLSHILTYYTVTMLVLAKTPLVPRPGMPLRHSWIDFTLSVLSVLGTVPIAGMNIYACRHRWEFVCIAVWKLTMSFTLSVIGAHQCFFLLRRSASFPAYASEPSFSREGSRYSYELRDHYQYTEPQHISYSAESPPSNMAEYGIRDWKATKSFLWLAVYFLGTIVGMVGLFRLVATVFWEEFLNDMLDYDQGSKIVRTITYVFASIAFAPLAICFLIYGGYVFIFFLWKGLVWTWNYARFFSYIDDKRQRVNIDWNPPNWLKHSIRNSILGVLFFGLFGAFYCDWILAAIARNWAGLPSNDIAVLFWVYFVAKRLPMLSF